MEAKVIQKHLLSSHRQAVIYDHGQADETVAHLWQRYTCELRSPRYFCRWHQAELGRGSLAYIYHPCATSTVCDGPLTEAYRLLIPMEGRVESRINGKRSLATPAAAAIHGPGQDLKLEVDPCRVLMLSLDGGSARMAFARRFRYVPVLETWAPDFSLGSPAASALWSLTLWTATELDRADSPLKVSPRTARALTRSLLSLFLDVLDEKYPFHARKTEDLAELHVRRIEAWIDANFAEPMGIEEMAAVVDVTSRSVQTGFRRLRGCTPMQYLRRRRLEQARRLLETATEETTVTNVALDSALFHLGRFSAAYRAMFGEKPSETLARSRSGA